MACEFFLNKYLRELELLMGNFSLLILKNLGEILEKLVIWEKVGGEVDFKDICKRRFGLDWSWFWI